MTEGPREQWICGARKWPGIVKFSPNCYYKLKKSFEARLMLLKNILEIIRTIRSSKITRIGAGGVTNKQTNT